MPPPYFENFGKRVIKSPKYYFVDTGLLAYLLDIEEAAQVSRDPLMGQLFENLAVLEALKARFNRGKVPNLYFFRDSHGNEIDLLYKSGHKFTGIEIKAATTWNTSFKKGLQRFDAHLQTLEKRYVIYSGDSMAFSDGIEALNFTNSMAAF